MPEEGSKFNLLLEGLTTDQLREAFDRADQIGETQIGEDIVFQADIADALSKRQQLDLKQTAPHVLGDFSIDRSKLYPADDLDNPYKVAQQQKELTFKK